MKKIDNGHNDNVLEKCILINNKKIAIREIEKYIKILQVWDGNDKHIKFLETLHNFMQQTKYKNYIPIHAVAKKMKLSESEAKEYAKAVLGDFNKKSFDSRIDTIIHIPKK